MRPPDSSTALSSLGQLASSCQCLFLQILNWNPSSWSTYPEILSLPPWGHSKQVSTLFPKTVLKLLGEFPRGLLRSLLFRLNIACSLEFRVSLTSRQVSNIHSWDGWCLTLTSIPGMILEQAIKQSICNHLGNHKVDRATRKAFRTAGYTRWI